MNKGFKNFRLPFPNFSQFTKSELDRRVVVVSIIGKTTVDNVSYKAVKIPGLIDDIEVLINNIDGKDKPYSEMCQLEAYFDSEENVIYLTLNGPMNTYHLSSILKTAKEEINKNGFLNYWCKVKNSLARTLLFMFSFSHILLLSSPGYSLNLHIIQLLKTLSYMRPKYQTAVSKALAKCREISEDWSFHGRLCSPRLLFIFSDCPFEIFREPERELRIARVKRLEHSIEDQIYIALRKSRLVKNVCSRAFFSIAPNDEFVFVKLNEKKHSSPLIKLLDFLEKRNNVISRARMELPLEMASEHFSEFLISSDIDDFGIASSQETCYSDFGMSQASTSYHSGAQSEGYFSLRSAESTEFIPVDLGPTRIYESSEFPPMDLSTSRIYECSDIEDLEYLDDEGADICGSFEVLNLSSSSSNHEEADEEVNFDNPEEVQRPASHSFKDFIMKHIKKAHLEGFSDNMGKYSNVKPYFEVPFLRSWIAAANTVLSDVEAGVKNPNTTSHQLENLLGTELKFSSARCKKVLPLALAAYHENLESHYNKDTHDKKVKQAIAVFIHHARGPAQNQFVDLLKDECDKIWRAGRQTCEAVSLNNNPCTKPKHQTSKGGLIQIGESEHWSGIQFYSSCNCGVKQGPRQDPFTLRSANCDFYQIIGQECGCIHLDRYHFPVFQPSSTDYREADVNKPISIGDTTTNQPVVQNESHDLQQASDSLSTVHEGPRPLLPSSTIPRGSWPSFSNPGCPDTASPPPEKHLQKPASTTEYLPGIMHLESPFGLLPLFPSWSLLCRGPSSLYSHNLGLQDLPSFVPGSAYLIPWDVSFKESDIFKSEPEVVKKTPNAPFQILKNSNRRHQRSPKEFLSVKIFVGIEYECVRGHRFMSSAPGVVLKANGTIVKEDANKITDGNMPLFVPCPCGKVNAQLMRVHIVTPKAPVFVTIEPKVRPAPEPCPTFITGERKPIPLSQSAYWVLRLPYVYASEKHIYSVPTRLKNLKYGELLGPMYGITPIPD